MQIEITPPSPPLGLGWAHMNHFQWKSFRLNLSNSVTNNSEERATRVFVLLDYIHSAVEIVSFKANDFSSRQAPVALMEKIIHNIRIGIETLQLLNNNRRHSIAATTSLQIYHIHVSYFMLNATQ